MQKKIESQNENSIQEKEMHPDVLNESNQKAILKNQVDQLDPQKETETKQPQENNENANLQNKSSPKPLSKIMDPENVIQGEIDRVIDIQGKGFSTIYKVQYKDRKFKNQWIPRRFLLNHLNLINDFFERRKQLKKSSYVGARNYSSSRELNNLPLRKNHRENSSIDEESVSKDDKNIDRRSSSQQRNIQNYNQMTYRPKRSEPYSGFEEFHRDPQRISSNQKSDNREFLEHARNVLNNNKRLIGEIQRDTSTANELAMEAFKKGNNSVFELLNLRQLLAKDIFCTEQIKQASKILSHVRIGEELYFQLSFEKSPGEPETITNRFIHFEKIEALNPCLLIRYFKPFLQFEE